MKLLKFGSKGAAVTDLQKQLIRQGYPIIADGDFGAKTEAALIDYQNAQGLLADGIFGRDTAAAISGEDTTRLLKEDDIAQAAELLGVDLAAIKAIVQVESAGSGYLKDGRVKILFERHIFHRLYSKQAGTAAAQSAQSEAPHICNSQTGGYIGGTGEYPRLARAMMFDPEIGMMSASWGLFQIMGFNHAAAGHDTIHSFVEAMKRSEGGQLQAFAHFVKNNKAMHQALKVHKWADFAKLYNGPAYKRNHYDSKLANAYARYKGAA